MRGVSIKDKTGGFLAFDLRHILALLGPEGRDSAWQVRGVECMGEASDELETVSERQAVIPGRDLYDLASKIHQVIDGEFAGYRLGDPRPWIVIRAVDSSGFDVFTDDERVQKAIGDRFHEVVALDFGEE
jgi:hypothetical protein